VADGSNPSTPTTQITIVSAPPDPILNTSILTLGNTLCPVGNTLCQADRLKVIAWLDSVKRARGLSNRALADRLGISVSFLSRLLHGARPLTLPALKNILAKLDLDAETGKSGDPFTAIYGMGTKKQKAGLDLKTAIDQMIVAKTVEGKTADTITFYRDNLGRFQWWCQKYGAPDLVLDFTSAILRAFLLYVQTARNRWKIGSTSSRAPATMQTVDAYWRTLQALFSWLVREEILPPDKNPMRKIKRPKVPTKIVQDIPPELIQKALALFSGDGFVHVRNRAMLYTFLDTGDRLGEFANLKVRDLDLVNGTARVFGKGDKERTVGLGPLTVEAIKAYLAIRLKCDGPLWLKADGCPLSYTGVQITIRRLKKLGGNVRWSPHTLRNTFAMNYLRAGGDPFTLQILGGWTDLEMPRHYTAALTAEDALKVHRRASPVDFLFKNMPGDDPKT
jgi:site-specific recombinase XerD